MSDATFEILLDHMADAMLDPPLRCDGAPSDTGTAIRKQVLRRALAEANQMGWELTPTRLPRAEPTGDHRPTHAFTAQKVRLIEQDGNDHFLVEFPDGSMGWHPGPLVPLDLIQ